MQRRERNGRVFYVAQVADHSKRRVTRAFARKSDCVEYEAMMRHRRKRIRDGLESPFVPILFLIFVELWLKKRKLHGKASTWTGEEQKLNKVWLPRFGPVYMHLITRTMIEEGLDALTAKGLSPATRNRHRALLHKIFHDAMKNEPSHAPKNPVTDISEISERLKTRPHGYWTEKREIEAYVKAMTEIAPHWGALAALMVYTGMRIGEALVLKWGDIDWERGTIRIERIWEIVSRTIQQRTKGGREEGSFENVPLFDELRAHLTEWKANTRRPKDDDFIVSVLRGKHFTYWQAEKVHKRAVKSARLPRATLHGLRHTAGRYFRSKGWQGDDLKGLMRHSDAKTTETYAPVDMNHLLKKARQLGEKLGSGSHRTHNQPNAETPNAL